MTPPDPPQRRADLDALHVIAVALGLLYHATRPFDGEARHIKSADTSAALAGALRHGATGFTFKDAPAEDLILAARTVARGGAWLHPAITARVLRAHARPGASPAALAPLTDREREILTALGSGASNADIARALHIGETTVKAHLSRGIFPKIGVITRAQGIVYAFDHGLVQPRPAPQD